MNLNCEAVRPGTYIQAWDTVWKVRSNDTLERVLLIQDTKRPTNRKRVHYQPGQLIRIIRSTHNRI